MLKNLDQVRELIKSGKPLMLAGEENLLQQLDTGNWIGGTSPYFMTKEGASLNQERLYVQEFPEYCQFDSVKVYDNDTLPQIPQDAPENGFSLIIIPALSQVHASFAKNAPDYPQLYMKALIGWISGVHLDYLGKQKPVVFNGHKQGKLVNEAVVMHFKLPQNKQANIGIINLFKQGGGDSIQFPKDGFTASDCLINGQSANFADYLKAKTIDTRLPLVADYHGAMINVSFQQVDSAKKQVDFYAPVFSGVEYKIAAPVINYMEEFNQSIENKEDADRIPLFSCNCILNYLYSELEGQRTPGFYGPITFGEIAYQLLNQTMTYLEVRDI